MTEQHYKDDETHATVEEMEAVQSEVLGILERCEAFERKQREGRPLRWSILGGVAIMTAVIVAALDTPFRWESVLTGIVSGLFPAAFIGSLLAKRIDRRRDEMFAEVLADFEDRIPEGSPKRRPALALLFDIVFDEVHDLPKAISLGASQLLSWHHDEYDTYDPAGRDDLDDDER